MRLTIEQMLENARLTPMSGINVSSLIALNNFRQLGMKLTLEDIVEIFEINYSWLEKCKSEKKYNGFQKEFERLNKEMCKYFLAHEELWLNFADAEISEDESGHWKNLANAMKDFEGAATEEWKSIAER